MPATLVPDQTFVRSVVEKYLRGWEGDSPLHRLHVWRFPNGDWAVSLNLNQHPVRFDLNIKGDVFYILWLCLPENMRGKGIGADLYRRFEAMASELGCLQIRQTPSGWTKTGETRESYLRRRGWMKQDGSDEVYKLLNQPTPEPNR